MARAIGITAAVGLLLDLVLVLAANAFEPPMVVVYGAFVAVVAVGCFVWSELDPAHRGASQRRR
jgi:hypothetical protein